MGNLDEEEGGTSAAKKSMCSRLMWMTRLKNGSGQGRADSE